MTGDDLVAMLAALANPLRLRILAKLAGRRDYVSHLAREIGISRPLLHMHLQRLEAAGLITGTLELSEDGLSRLLEGQIERALDRIRIGRVPVSARRVGRHRQRGRFAHRHQRFDQVS